MEANPPPVRRDYQFEFTGNALEYFRIWIVNILLTIATLGIYSAWAKVRNNRYFYGNTILDGSAFEYTADPVRILKGRLIAVALLILYQFAGVFSWQAGLAAALILMLVFPALVVMSMRFRMRYTSWRNIQFSFKPNFKRVYMLFGLPLLLFTFVLYGGSQINRIMEENPEYQQNQEIVFDQDIAEDQNSNEEYLHDEDEVYFSPEEAQQQAEQAQRQQAIAVQIKDALIIAYIPLLFFWLLFPWWLRHYYAFLASNSRYGTSQFSFIATTAELYAIYIIAALIAIPISLVIGGLATTVGVMADDTSAVMVIVMPLAMIATMMAVNAYIQTKKTNVIYSGLSLEEIGFTSDLKFGKMFWLYFSNTVAIILSLGLMIPWAKVRMARYRAECMTLYAADFDGFQARLNKDLGAQGAELSDVMDFDLGL